MMSDLRNPWEKGEGKGILTNMPFINSKPIFIDQPSRGTKFKLQPSKSFPWRFPARSSKYWDNRWVKRPTVTCE